MSRDAQSASLPLAIEYTAPSNLKFNPRNVRSHKPQQIAAIARSIQTFGFNVPVVADEDGQIFADHGRVAAALKLGLDAVSVVRIAHLSQSSTCTAAVWSVGRSVTG